jgi:hypothetical protein
MESATKLKVELDEIDSELINQGQKGFNSQELNVREKTRRRTMTYNKPEVVKLSNALNSIQGNLKSQHVVIDNDPSFPQDRPTATSLAYEADE